MATKMDSKYAYMLSQLRKIETAIRNIGMGTSSIEHAAESLDINVNELETNIKIFEEKYAKICDNPRSLRALYENEDITLNIYNNLKSHYNTIDDFGVFTKEEFCKKMRSHRIAIVSILKLIDAMIKFNVSFSNITSDDKITEMKALRDMIDNLR